MSSPPQTLHVILGVGVWQTLALQFESTLISLPYLFGTTSASLVDLTAPLHPPETHLQYVRQEPHFLQSSES